jgi:hypothetical protein
MTNENKVGKAYEELAPEIRVNPEFIKVRLTGNDKIGVVLDKEWDAAKEDLLSGRFSPDSIQFEKTDTFPIKAGDTFNHIIQQLVEIMVDLPEGTIPVGFDIEVKSRYNFFFPKEKEDLVKKCLKVGFDIEWIKKHVLDD